MSFHPEVLSAAQKRILGDLSPVLVVRGLYLGGGTALAIHLGHRRSVDLDWFTPQRIPDPMQLAQNIRDAGVHFLTGSVERGTLHGTVSGVRVSLLEYRYPSLEPLVAWHELGCSIASLADLACMKLAAVAGRGSKKDFVDVYALGVKFARLQNMLELYRQKYSVDDIGHVLYSLAYFDDADLERMPQMLSDTDWNTVKTTIRQWLKDIAG